MAYTNIRLATESDFEAVQDLNHRLFISDSRHLNDLNTNWPYEDEGMKYYRQRIAGDGGVCLIAESDGKIIGYVIGGWSHINFSAYKGKRGELENIFVSEDYRENHVGSELVRALMKWFKEQGVNYVMVDAYAKNVDAIEFYKHEGFEPYSINLWKKVD